MNRKERREAMRKALTRRVEQRLADRTTVAVHRAVDAWEALADELARQLLGLPDVLSEQSALPPREVQKGAEEKHDGPDPEIER